MCAQTKGHAERVMHSNICFCHQVTLKLSMNGNFLIQNFLKFAERTCVNFSKLPSSMRLESLMNRYSFQKGVTMAEGE